jgi:hypothetical protein
MYNMGRLLVLEACLAFLDSKSMNFLIYPFTKEQEENKTPKPSPIGFPHAESFV